MFCASFGIARQSCCHAQHAGDDGDGNCCGEAEPNAERTSLSGGEMKCGSNEGRKLARKGETGMRSREESAISGRSASPSRSRGQASGSCDSGPDRGQDVCGPLARQGPRLAGPKDAPIAELAMSWPEVGHWARRSLRSPKGAGLQPWSCEPPGKEAEACWSEAGLAKLGCQLQADALSGEGPDGRGAPEEASTRLRRKHNEALPQPAAAEALLQRRHGLIAPGGRDNSLSADAPGIARAQCRGPEGGSLFIGK